MRNAVVLLLAIVSMLLLSACEDESSEQMGTVTFGANYGIVNCPVTVEVFIESGYAGEITFTSDTLTTCDLPGNVTKELSVATYAYRVEIRPLSGTGCMKDVTGRVEIRKDHCTKVFIDFREIGLQEVTSEGIILYI